jgi:hypothetical protein
MIKNVLPNISSELYSVGEGYSCSFSVKNGAINCTWHPSMPNARKLRRIVQLEKYFAARNAFFGELSKHLGGQVVCVVQGGNP